MKRLLKGLKSGLIIGLVGIIALSFHVSGSSIQLGGWDSSKVFSLAGNSDSQLLLDRGQDTYLILSRNASGQIGVTTTVYSPNVNNMLVGNITTTDWSGNVTLHGFRMGSANGTWDYAGNAALVTVDPYGAYNNGGVFLAFPTGLTVGSTYYVQAFAGGYASDGQFFIFYGNVVPLVAVLSSTDPAVPNVTTSNATYFYDPGTITYPTITLIGGINAASGTLSNWGFVASENLTQVSNITAGGVIISETGSIFAPYTYYLLTRSFAFATDGVLYYRAYAQTSNGTIGYGEIRSLNVTRSSQYPVTPSVFTANASYFYALGTSTFPNIFLTGGVYGSANSLVRWGFITGTTNASVANISAGGQVYPTLGTGYAPFVFDAHITDQEFSTGGTLYIRAFAQSSAGVIGYGNVTVLNISLPAFPVTVVGDGQIINENVVRLYATLNNTSGYSIQQCGFRWGTSNGNFTGAWSNTTENQTTLFLYSYSSPLLILAENTTYYWQAAVLVGGNWTFSQTYTFNTTFLSGLITNYMPVVRTNKADTITDTGFTTTITILDVGDGNVTNYGLEWKFPNDAYWNYPLGVSGNFAAGNYTSGLTGFTKGQTVYYRAHADNRWGSAKGNPYYVVIGVTDSSGNGGTGPVGGGGNSFTNVLKGWMNALGMDNNLGHWAFMGMITIAIAIIFFIGIIYVHIKQPNRLVETILGMILLALEIIVLGAFLFSGLLGIWPVFLLVFAVVGLIVIFVGNLFNHGRASGAAS